MEPSYSIQQLHEQEIVRNQEITNQQQGEIDKQKAETEISAEFWNASPLTKTEHDEDIGLLEQADTPTMGCHTRSESWSRTLK